MSVSASTEETCLFTQASTPVVKLFYRNDILYVKDTWLSSRRLKANIGRNLRLFLIN